MEWVETTAKTLDEAREAALGARGTGMDGHTSSIGIRNP